MREADETGLKFIELWEDFSPVIYLDIANFPTIGIGHLILKGETFNEPISHEEAYEILGRDMDIAERGVNTLITVPLSDLQFNALASLTFNIGVFAFKGSTVRSRLNRGEYTDAADAFLYWIYAGGKQSKGLIHRRAAERGMFLEGTE